MSVGSTSWGNRYSHYDQTPGTWAVRSWNGSNSLRRNKPVKTDFSYTTLSGAVLNPRPVTSGAPFVNGYEMYEEISDNYFLDPQPGTPVSGLVNTILTAGTDPANTCNLSIWDANDDLNLWGKLREKLHGHGFNGLTTIVEMGPTFDTLHDIAKRVYTFVKKARQGDALGAANALVNRRHGLSPGQVEELKRVIVPGIGSASTSWLTWQYGIKPLLADAHAAGEALAASLEVPITHKVRVKLSKKKSGGGWMYRGLKADVYPNIYYFTSARWQRREDKVLTLFYKEKLPASVSLGLSPYDLPSALWEIVPFSFVVDWFLPIGDYLEAMSTRSTVEGTWMMSHFRRSSIGDVQLVTNSNGAYPYWDPNGTYSHNRANFYRKVHYLRTVTTDPPPIPLPTVKDGVSDSWQRAVSAVALLSTVFGKSPRPRI